MQLSGSLLKATTEGLSFVKAASVAAAITQMNSDSLGSSQLCRKE